MSEYESRYFWNKPEYTYAVIAKQPREEVKEFINLMESNRQITLNKLGINDFNANPIPHFPHETVSVKCGETLKIKAYIFVKE